MAKRMLVAGPVRTTALYPLTNGHVLGLRARARRANLVVRTREEPPRPTPVQVVRATGPVVVHSTSGDDAPHAQVQAEGGVRFWCLRKFLQIVTEEPS